MSERDVAEAEGIMKMRALSLFIMAGGFVFVELISLRSPDIPYGLLTWGIMVVGLALNVGGVARGGIFNRRAIRRLIEDETTREHRRTGQTAGFWAAMGSGLIVLAVDSVVPLPVEAAVRVVLTASLTAAMIAFATLEWMAARHG